MARRSHPTLPLISPSSPPSYLLKLHDVHVGLETARPGAPPVGMHLGRGREEGEGLTTGAFF